MLSCYGHSGCASMTDARQKVWKTKVSRTICSALNLCSLPRTNEAFKENVLRAHMQVAMWKTSDKSEPAAPDPLQHGSGWILDTCTGCLVARGGGDNELLAPEEIKKFIKCSYESKQPCKTKRYGCTTTNVPCTEFFPCQRADGVCCNELNYFTELDD